MSLKRGAKDALQPLTRPVTSRFTQLQERADHTEALATTAVQQTEQIQAGLWGLATKVDEIGGRLDLLFDQLNVDLQVMGEYARITERLSNRLGSHADDLAERARHLERDAAELHDVLAGGAGAERLLGEPLAIQQLADLAPESRVLTVGAGTGALPLSLAALGHHVTAVDASPLPVEHPHVESVVAPLTVWDGPTEPFDAIVCFAEAGAVGPDAMRRLVFWLQPTGVLVLGLHLPTPGADAGAGTPQDDTAVDTAIDALPDSWTVTLQRTFRRRGPGTWEAMPEDTARPATAAPGGTGSGTGQGFAVVVARPRPAAR